MERTKCEFCRAYGDYASRSWNEDDIQECDCYNVKKVKKINDELLKEVDKILGDNSKKCVEKASKSPARRF